MIIARDDWAQ